MIRIAITAVVMLFGASSILAAPTAGILPASPPDLSVVITPGLDWLSPIGVIQVAPAKLTFDPPVIRQATFSAKAPRDYASWFAPWQPWPGKGEDGLTTSITLCPHVDENGILILGALFRSVLKDSVVVTTADGSKTFKMGEDYQYLPPWGQIANLGGKLGEVGKAELKITYKYALQRLDLVQVDGQGKVSVKKGASVIVCPALPEADPGAVALAGIYIAPWKAVDNPNFVPPAQANAASDYAITQFEILPMHPAAAVAPIHQEALARTLKKLQLGQAVKIAFMGASIEVGAESGPWWDEKIKFTDQDKAYRGRVISGLRKLFPKATITAVEADQGGTQTKFGLQVLDRKVLPAKPDLVLIGFGGNDVAGPIGGAPNNPPAQFKQDMLAMVRKAKAAGMEVMLVVTMQTNPWLANGQSQRWPEYRKAMLEIGEEENVAVADVYAEWMNLATRGIPPFSQLHNWINHPGPFGHGVYAQVILRFFQ